MKLLSETREVYRIPIDERWVFVRNGAGRATNVRVLRGTTIIEVLHRGEKILVDVAEMKAIDFAGASVYNGV